MASFPYLKTLIKLIRKLFLNFCWLCFVTSNKMPQSMTNQRDRHLLGSIIVVGAIQNNINRMSNINIITRGHK